MPARKLGLVSLLAVVMLFLAPSAQVFADAPFIPLEIKNEFPYDNYLFSCGDFDVWAEGIHTNNIKLKIDEAYNILRNNAQTSEVGTIYNKSTGKYLIDRGQWTWNMFFENNISVKSVLAGGVWRITNPDGGVVWLDTGVEKYVGIQVNLLTGEVILTPPYHIAGQNPDYTQLESTICAALR